jgi:hypothetical protein
VLNEIEGWLVPKKVEIWLVLKKIERWLGEEWGIQRSRGQGNS